MPIFKDRKKDEGKMKRGDLFVKFEIKFPKTLREEQRLKIQRILGGSTNDN